MKAQEGAVGMVVLVVMVGVVVLVMLDIVARWGERGRGASL